MTNPEPFKTSSLPSMPGVKRDGTVTDSAYYNDAQWVRFIREGVGRPRKMGGYQLATNLLNGPPRGVLAWSHQYTNRIVVFSTQGVQYVDVDVNGLGGTVTDITPAGYTPNAQTLWSWDILYDAAAGSQATVLICSPMQTLTNMDDPTNNAVYFTPLGTNPVAQLALITDANAKAPGGVFCTAPYAFLLGIDGNVTWSDANLPENYGGVGSNPGGDQGTARVTGTKLVKGLPMRSGSGPGGMLWSLDSVIRADFVGGSTIFQFSQICNGESSLMSQNAVIQYNGNWYWMGINKFFVSNGSQVSELPNPMSKNFVFDNINMAQRQKVFVQRMPRWGEIWWFFPFGDATENTHAVIFNVLLNTWYDVALTRSSGVTPTVLRYPLMTDWAPNNQMSLNYTATVGTVHAGDVIRGSTSGATGSVQLVTGSGPFTAQVTLTGAVPFTAESFVDINSTATGAITAANAQYSLFTHENGNDAVGASEPVAIPAWFETCNFGYPTGGTQVTSTQGVDLNTDLVRVEPDFVLTGNLTMEVIGRQYAMSPDQESPASTDGEYVITPTTTGEDFTGVLDMREQWRMIRLKFTSNTLGGFFECGDVLIYPVQGDVRS